MLPQVAPRRESQHVPQGRILTAPLGVFLILAVARCGFTQNRQPIVQARMVLATDAVHPGSAAHAAVIAQIAPGYHINDHHPTLSYLIPTQLKFEPENQLAVEKIAFPKGTLRKFVFAENGLSVYQGRLIVPALLQVASGVGPGDYTLRGQLSYQACNANACFPPANAALVLPVHVVGRSVALKSANPEVFGRHGSE